MRSLFKKQPILSVANKYYRQSQRYWVTKMTAFTYGLSTRNLRMCLFLFVIAGLSFNMWNIYKGFTMERSRSTRFAKGSISKIIKLQQDTSALHLKSSSGLDSQIQSITGFRTYLENLKISTDGKRIYDSICIYRPGLLDSLCWVENYYINKNKK